MAVIKLRDLPEHLRGIDSAILAVKEDLGFYRGVGGLGDVKQVLGLAARDKSVLEKGLAIFPITEGPEKGSYIIYIPFRI
jgi:hypothetical protein